jgi:hypothetical protein
MSPPRFRLRTLLIAVAVAAVLLGGGIGVERTWRLSVAYRQRADWYALMGRQCRMLVAIHSGSGMEEGPGLAAYYAGRRDLFARLERKYRLAAARPWLPPESDPPDPPPP